MKRLITDIETDKGERVMGVYLECPQCGDELNHDDEAYHLNKENGDYSVLSCDKCDWVGNVRLKVEFEEIENVK